MNISKQNVIAIDGSVASGKGHASELVAKKLDFSKLDSGSIYRTLTLLTIEACIHHTDTAGINRLVDRELHRLRVVGSILHLDGKPVGEEIRTVAVANLTPLIASNPYLRKRIIPLQRMCLGEKGLVVEGRDMGSVVFPEARLKVFLTAPPAIRAWRRYHQRKQSSPYAEVLADLKARDLRDQTRTDSPLVCVDGAKVIDTSCMPVEQVASEIIRWWERSSEESTT